MAQVVEIDRGVNTPDWARKYPPMLSFLAALLITLAVLPSALNLPQSNPQETLEFAPVPPDDSDDPPQTGNLASLSAARSQSIEGGGADGGEGGGAAPPPLKGSSIDPGTLCVGQPPRQTADPLSPPCVPSFTGDNGGKTYGIGVTGDEVRLLYYLEGGISYINASDPSTRNAPRDKLYDLWQKPESGEHLTVKALRVWQEYFNTRFQTYGRDVHLYVFFSSCAPSCAPNHRRADAARILSEVGPFAVIADATEGAEDDLLKSLARKGVLNFGSFSLRPNSLYNTFPKQIWSYLPSVEQQAESYGSYVCKKIVGKPAVLASADLQARSGGTRKIGMIHTTDPHQQGLQHMAKIVRQKVEACGGTIEKVAQFEQCCLAQDNGENPQYAQRQMAEFSQAGITTILWPGGINGQYAKTAAGSGYFPEWVLLGDGILDAHRPIRLSQSTASFDKRAIIISPEVLQPAVEQQRCYQAFREFDTQYPTQDLRYYTCEFYRNLFQFFVGVQVSGPKLTPTNMDVGFHKIPQRRESTHPEVPACFYLPGDYTCVKDAQAMYWDAAGRAPGSDEPGCWRSIDKGKRYFADEWSNDNVSLRADEPCNGYDASVRFNLA